MTTAGKVFLFLNAILALAFLLFAAPVARFRITQQELIEKEKQKIPALEKSVDDLERERVRLLADIERADRLLTEVKTRGVNVKSDFERVIARRTDDLNDQQDKVKRWTTSLAEIRAEIDSRESEIAALDSEMKSDTEGLATVNGEVADLEGQLAQARKDLDEARADVVRQYERLVALERSAGRAVPGSASR